MKVPSKQYIGEELSSLENESKRKIDPYLPSKELIKAVNLSILLGRPLLLMGDPGCGKTSLALSVAYEIYREKYQEHYFEWNVKSTSKAKDGIYTYNSLKRFQDIQTSSKEKSNIEAKSIDGKDANSINVQEYTEYLKSNYIHLGPLGTSFKTSTEESPSILLIDEIDKAGIDFPNDLLLELDKNEFEIDESHIPEEMRKVKVNEKSKPIIFITSNREKELPPAFLRRCIYFWMDFPEKEDLKKILLSHFKKEGVDQNYEKLDTIIEKFVNLRKQHEKRTSVSEKNLSTSELIDWFKAIVYYKNRKSDPNNQILEGSMEAEMIRELEKIDQEKEIPFKYILLKNYDSLMRKMDN